MSSLQTLQNLDPYEFEHFVADLWEAQGWQTEVHQESGDAGIDIIARRHHPVSETHVIQAKRYGQSNKVGGPEIQQYASLKQQVPEADAVVVVTTSEFTRAARKRARELNVKLVDGKALSELASEHMQLSPSNRQQTAHAEPIETTSDDVTDGHPFVGVLGLLGLAIKFAAENIADLLYILVVLYVGLKITDVMLFNIPLV